MDIFRNPGWFLLLAFPLAVNAICQTQHPLMQSETVVWAGLDYSLVRMIGNDDFQDPEKIVAEMPTAWNSLFIREVVERMEKTLGKTVKIDTEGIAQRNKLLKTDQVIRKDGTAEDLETSHITADDLSAAVRSYQLKQKEGLGLVFVIDRLVKMQRQGAVYVVFFDVSTRKVLVSERVVTRAAGFGFRNYWFRVPKDSVAALTKYRS